MKRFAVCRALLLASLSIAAAPLAQAQIYPSKPARDLCAGGLI